MIVKTVRNKEKTARKMKALILQPPYSTDFTKAEQYLEIEKKMLDACDDSADIIVCPEACDIPCLAPSNEHYYSFVEKHNAEILEYAAATAKRCNAILFINANSRHEGGLRNTTYAFDRSGNCVGHYYKEHLTPGESFKRKLDCAYTFEPSEVTIIEIEGLRFAFLTCYDFYFYEMFSKIAQARPDVIIGCSHQRSDTHDALEIMTRFLAYNTNAYVLRSSVSMDENSNIGGASMAVAPDGRVLANLYSKVGIAEVEFDPHAKYYKPAGFGNPPSAHWEYIEKGRRPWKYRSAGPDMIKPNDLLPYPRTCAHRGFNSVAPENSMPAFGAAIAMGAEEIEFDLWDTKDHEIVSIHDSKLDRVSDGTGKVYDHTYEELLQFDFGKKKDEAYSGMKILRFEEILQKFAGKVIMNVHIKTRTNDVLLEDWYIKKLIGLIDKYDCRKYVYFMTGNDNLLAQLRDAAPDICRCTGGGKEPWRIVDRAIELGCTKVQLFKPYFNQEMIDKAHANGILCNVFWSDDAEECERFLDMGIDCILTNDYNRISQIVAKRKKYGGVL